LKTSQATAGFAHTSMRSSAHEIKGFNVLQNSVETFGDK